MNSNVLKISLIVLFSCALLTGCDADDEAGMPSTEGLFDVEWTAINENGSASIVLRSDNTWTSTNSINNETLNGEWSWIDQSNLIIKFREFVFFEDTFSEFYRFNNITENSVDVEFTTSPNPIQPNNNSSFTDVGTWTR